MSDMEIAMSRTTDQEKAKIFSQLHNPDRPVFQMGHARRGNSSEDYKSSTIRETATRLLKPGMEMAHGVIDAFAKHARKSK